MTKDYSKNKIHKIYSHLGDKIYIGSTVCELVSQRMVKHRGSYKYWKKHNANYTTSFSLFEEYGVENCIIELIEAKPCIDINEQAKLEGSYIRTLECVNKNIPGRTRQEWRDEHISDIRRRDVLYRINSKGVKPKTDTLDKYNIQYDQSLEAYVLNTGGVNNDLILSQDEINTKNITLYSKRRRDVLYRINSKGVSPKVGTLEKYNIQYNELLNKYQ